MDLNHGNKIVEDAIFLAEFWQKKANKLRTSGDIALLNQMARLLSNPLDKIILSKMIDQSFRSSNKYRTADQINYLIKRYSLPLFLTDPEKILFRLFLSFGRYVPSLSVPLFIDNIRKRCRRWVQFGEADYLPGHLQKMKDQGLRVNLNHLGEAVLGEGEARNRLDIYLADLENPAIESISIKISTIYSQIQPIAHDYTINILQQRLSKLYKAAMNNLFPGKDNRKAPKSVNLDMEEYKDLYITLELFTKVLDQNEFKRYPGCIVLQSYLPESYKIQQELVCWAKKRVKSGGSPIKIRLVKGANMEMELFESSLRNWPLATFDNKPSVDANYKRMIFFGMNPENIEAVHMGIASHNLFDLAYAYRLALENKVEKSVTFEMLEGMADHVRRAIAKTVHDVLLYTPVAGKKQFINAVAYLVRRLDENTGKENFLSYASDLTPASTAWKFLKDQFVDSVKLMKSTREDSFRAQNRGKESFVEKGTFFENDFINEPDTDFSIQENRVWADEIRKKWQKKYGTGPELIPLVIAGKEIFENRKKKDLFDYFSGEDEVVFTASCSLARDEDIREAIFVARADPDSWRKKSFNERHKILSRTAANLRLLRGDFIGAAAATTGKIFTESDGEVSEAVDFAEFYPFSVNVFESLKNIKCEAKGVGLVISPWNFPIAIPCGGIAASLAAGNTVIFKPASDAVLVAWYLCKAFWEAGVSKKTLQFLPCTGEEAGSKLAKDPDVDFIIFTGSTDTGRGILKERPDLFLCAETGGKNATIVTSMSDRDQAIKNILHSAFSNSGQKCSATSLVILDKEVYEDKDFKKRLVDGAKSYATGSVWDFKNRMGPLTHIPGGALKRGIDNLDSGETWALKPKILNGNQRILTPGIKWGVAPGSFTHMTEFFGPVIGVIKAENIYHAIKLVNQTGFGLTSAIESLDKREQEIWKKKIRAGNLYINRGTTGAVVLRQPFGGMGKSAMGAGTKAGGPNYVSQFMDYEETGYPFVGAIKKEYRLLRIAGEWEVKLSGNMFPEFNAEIKKTVKAIKSYIYNGEQEFFLEKDYFHLRGQDNILRYLPMKRVLVRLHEKDTLFDVLGRIAAAEISGSIFQISIPVDISNRVTRFLLGRDGIKFIGEAEILMQTDEEIINMLPALDRIRYGAPDRVPFKIHEAAARAGLYISSEKVMMEGRIELLRYYKEQSISVDYHRYGNLGERGLD